MPESVGRCLRKAVNASRPPADAPTPTIGNKFPLVSGLLIGGGGDLLGGFFLACGCSFACDAALARIAECFDRRGIFFAMLFSLSRPPGRARKSGPTLRIHHRSQWLDESGHGAAR